MFTTENKEALNENEKVKFLNNFGKFCAKEFKDESSEEKKFMTAQRKAHVIHDDILSKSLYQQLEAFRPDLTVKDEDPTYSKEKQKLRVASEAKLNVNKLFDGRSNLRNRVNEILLILIHKRFNVCETCFLTILRDDPVRLAASASNELDEKELEQKHNFSGTISWCSNQDCFQKSVASKQEELKELEAKQTETHDYDRDLRIQELNVEIARAQRSIEDYGTITEESVATKKFLVQLARQDYFKVDAVIEFLEQITLVHPYVVRVALQYAYLCR